MTMMIMLIMITLTLRLTLNLTRAALEALDEAGLGAGEDKEMLMDGGATRSPLWLQMHRLGLG
jgi:hypothetical protein